MSGLGSGVLGIGLEVGEAIKSHSGGSGGEEGEEDIEDFRGLDWMVLGIEDNGSDDKRESEYGVREFN